MITKLDNIFQRCSVKNIVSTSKNLCIEGDVVPKYVADVRSATFEALGIARMKDVRVALVVDEHYISSVYTAITEAWFQRVNILIVTYNGNLYKPIEYLDRCIVGKSMLLKDSDIDDICKNITYKNGPSLLRTDIHTEHEMPIDYSYILQVLNKQLSGSDMVFCYNSRPFDINGICTMVNIKPEHKYCVVSKYVGYLMGTESKAALCIPECLLAYDSNIFNFRDITDGFTLIVLADDSGIFSKLSAWISSNSINVKKLSNADDIKLDNSKSLFYVKNN